MKKIIIALVFLSLFSCSKETTIKETHLPNESAKVAPVGIIEDAKEEKEVEGTEVIPGEEISLEGILLGEVQNHSENNDCYTIIDGKVYDISSFFGKHKGGDKNLAKLCGKDGSSAFNSQHGENEKAKVTRDSFYIGEYKE